MNKEDSLRFVQDRLRQHHAGPFTRELRLGRPRVMRRVAVELEKGETRAFEGVDDSVQVHCSSGSVWITHDGDCKDIILVARESYRAEREEAMHLFALEPSVVELEFADEVLDS